MDLIAEPAYVEHWTTSSATSTYGKREKDVRIEPGTGKLFYYKLSDSRYPWDFWCEVIASKLGQILGLDIATYEPAYSKDDKGNYIWGCLSPLLHDPERGEEFVHGQSYLKWLKPDFETHRGTDHEYELIDQALKLAGGRRSDVLKFHEMLVFDALICNRDRHQENWALIRSTQSDQDILRPKSREASSVKAENWADIFASIAAMIFASLSARLAPIYDSGTSLGHNLLEARMALMLAEPSRAALKRFATGPKATAHIRWNGSRVRHDDLLRHIGRVASTHLLPALSKVTEAFDHAQVAELLEMIDSKVVRTDTDQVLIPKEYMLNPVRKAFIRELLYLRHQELCKLQEQIRGWSSGST
jgi:hypothetical protein